MSAIKRGEAEEDLDLDLQMGALSLDGNELESQPPVKVREPTSRPSCM